MLCFAKNTLTQKVMGDATIRCKQVCYDAENHLSMHSNALEIDCKHVSFNAESDVLFKTKIKELFNNQLNLTSDNIDCESEQTQSISCKTLQIQANKGILLRGHDKVSIHCQGSTLSITKEGGLHFTGAITINALQHNVSPDCVVIKM